MRRFDGNVGLTRRQWVYLLALYGVTAAAMVFVRPHVREIPLPWLELIGAVCAFTAMAATALLAGVVALAKTLGFTAHQRPGTLANFLFLLLGAILLSAFATPFNFMLMADLGTSTINGFEIGPGRLRDVLAIPFWILLLLINGLALGILYGAAAAFLRLCVDPFRGGAAYHTRHEDKPPWPR